MRTVAPITSVLSLAARRLHRGHAIELIWLHQPTALPSVHPDLVQRRNGSAAHAAARCAALLCTSLGRGRSSRRLVATIHRKQRTQPVRAAPHAEPLEQTRGGATDGDASAAAVAPLEVGPRHAAEQDVTHPVHECARDDPPDPEGGKAREVEDVTNRGG